MVVNGGPGQQLLSGALAPVLAASPRQPQFAAALLQMAWRSRGASLAPKHVESAAAASGALQAGVLQLEEQLLGTQRVTGRVNGSSGNASSSLPSGGASLGPTGEQQRSYWAVLADLYAELGNEDMVDVVRQQKLGVCMGAARAAGLVSEGRHAAALRELEGLFGAVRQAVGGAPLPAVLLPAATAATAGGGAGGEASTGAGVQATVEAAAGSVGPTQWEQQLWQSEKAACLETLGEWSDLYHAAANTLRNPDSAQDLLQAAAASEDPHLLRQAVRAGLFMGYDGQDMVKEVIKAASAGSGPSSASSKTPAASPAKSTRGSNTVGEQAAGTATAAQGDAGAGGAAPAGGASPAAAAAAPQPSNVPDRELGPLLRARLPSESTCAHMALLSHQRRTGQVVGGRRGGAVGEVVTSVAQAQAAVGDALRTFVTAFTGLHPLSGAARARWLGLLPPVSEMGEVLDVLHAQQQAAPSVRQSPGQLVTLVGRKWLARLGLGDDSLTGDVGEGEVGGGSSGGSSADAAGLTFFQAVRRASLDLLVAAGAAPSDVQTGGCKRHGCSKRGGVSLLPLLCTSNHGETCTQCM